MLLPPSFMTENKFWTSEKPLLTADWNKLFSFTSPMRRITCFHWNRPRSTPIALRKDAGKGDAGRGSFQRRASKRSMSSVLLANVQSLKNVIDDLLLRLSYQWDIKNCNMLCFTEMWLNKETDNIELAGFSMHWQNRDATSGKTRGGGVCLVRDV
jgi:hypothetical protein